MMLIFDFPVPLDETPLYSKNHVLCTKTIALNEVVPKDPPKKKRGRPRKDASKATADSSQKIQEPVSIRDEPMSKRKRKVPQRCVILFVKYTWFYYPLGHGSFRI